MSGHSKWKNIMHKKEKTDAQRAKIFTKIGKEMAVAVKEGGADPATNAKLRDLIAKAKSNNVPNDNIERVIKKASGADAVDYETIVYEGYGIGGVAVIVETMTDNRNRTAAEVRHYFDKFGGNMGQTGCVSYLFTDKGIIVVESEGVDEEKLMEDAIETGADDLSNEGEIFEIYTAPADVYSVKEGLEGAGYKIVSAEVEKVPSNYVALDAEQAIKMNRLLDALEENDDVQNVWHNWENDDE
jgi:YebC/PmpR family DNA-binding regulatory protein